MAPVPNALRVGTVHRLEGWRRALFPPAAWGLDAYYRLLRVKLAASDRAALEAVRAEGMIVIAWHNRSLVFPKVVRALALEPVHTLISASRLAAWEAEYFRRRGLPAIRGSSTRGGALAAREALRVLKRGGTVALSPDGPSGPLYTFQRGAAMIARRFGGPIVLMGANCPRAHRVKTWDRHLFPWPGQAVRVQLRVIGAFSELGASDDVEACACLRSAMLEINDE